MTTDDELRAVAVTVARIEGKLDRLLADSDDHEARLRTLESHGTARHETRLADLERMRWLITGAAVAAGATAGGLSSVLVR